MATSKRAEGVTLDEPGSFSTAILVPLLEALQARGITSEAALDGAQISPKDLRDGKGNASSAQIVRVYRNAIALAQDPEFGFEAGSRYHLASYGIVGFAVLSCTTFRDATDLISRYSTIAQPLTTLSFDIGENGEAGCSIGSSVPEEDSSLYAFVIAMRMGQLHTCFRDLLGEGFMPTRILVSYPAAAAPLSERAGCDVVYKAGDNRIFVSDQLLERRLELGNPVTYASLTAICDSLLAEFHQQTGFAGRIQKVLGTHPGHNLSFQDVSDLLGVAPRTLRRKLASEGTSFQSISDDFKRQLAMKYLRESRLKIEDIAMSLGFTEAVSFRRSFRRWTGMTPKEARKGTSSLAC